MTAEISQSKSTASPSAIAQFARAGSKRYGALEVLKGVDLAVAAGQFTAIIGKSGSGKSTLLGIVSGLEKADAGRVLVQGQDLSAR